ncbi:MAG: hypothetical protein GDA38_08170 [Hormoscilla sp. SP12CHS1]|nr:hypothetical protein [Hormoscilla sp. SP12CHS1]
MQLAGKGGCRSRSGCAAASPAVSLAGAQPWPRDQHNQRITSKVQDPGTSQTSDTSINDLHVKQELHLQEAIGYLK